MPRVPIPDGDLTASLPDRLVAARSGRAGSQVAYPIGLRALVLLRTARLTPTLARLTFGGPELAGFVSHLPEEPIRFVFPEADGRLRLPERNGELLRWPRPATVSREYTVRRYDAAANTLDVDVVLHDGGVAATWAVTAEPGAAVHVAGPPGGFAVPWRYDRYLLAGDLTALPQIARYLEELPADAQGWALVEVGGAAEEITLTAPRQVRVRWVHRAPGVPAGAGDALAGAVRALPIPSDARTFVWLAGEAGMLKPLRRWARTELCIPRDDTRIRGYWKRGTADFDDD